MSTMTQTQLPQSAHLAGSPLFEQQPYPQTGQQTQQYPNVNIPQQLAQQFVPAQIAQRFVPLNVAQQFVPKDIARQYVPPQIAQQIAIEVLRTQAMAYQALQQGQQQSQTPQYGQYYGSQNPFGAGLSSSQQGPYTQQWAGPWSQQYQQAPSLFSQHPQHADYSPFGQIRTGFPQF
jgi:hypothetical protein